MKYFRKIIGGFQYSLTGLRHAFQRDTSFRIKVISSPLLVVIAVIAWPLSQTEFLFLVLSYALVLMTELINTAFERALERLHPERHELIGATKDIASAAVFIAICFAIVVAGSLIISRVMIRL